MLAVHRNAAPRAAGAYLPLVGLRVIDVHRSYVVGTPSCRAIVRALDGVTFSARGGEVVGITGSHGAGKSTLLRIAAGLQHPDRGAVHLRDARVSEAAALVPESDRARDRGLYVSAASIDAVVLRLRALTDVASAPYLAAVDLDAHEVTPLATRLIGHTLRTLARHGAVVLVAARKPCDLAGLTTRTLTLHHGHIATGFATP